MKRAGVLLRIENLANLNLATAFKGFFVLSVLRPEPHTHSPRSSPPGTEKPLMAALAIASMRRNPLSTGG